MIFNKLWLLGLLAAGICAATPIEYIFSGTGSGSVGSTSFTAAPFTITFTSDTTQLEYGTDACTMFSSNCSTPNTTLSDCCTDDVSTPSSTSNSFTIDGISGSFSNASPDGPAVFLNPVEEDVGVWFFGEPDFLPTASSSFSSYSLTTSIGPLGVTAFGNLQFIPPGPGLASSAGEVDFSSISSATFQAVLMSNSSSSSMPSGGVSPAAVTPEPSTLLMLGMGLLATGLGKLRRRA